jgi:hypothetical protein
MYGHAEITASTQSLLMLCDTSMQATSRHTSTLPETKKSLYTNPRPRALCPFAQCTTLCLCPLLPPAFPFWLHFNLGTWRSLDCRFPMDAPCNHRCPQSALFPVSSDPSAAFTARKTADRQSPPLAAALPAPGPAARRRGPPPAPRKRGRLLAQLSQLLIHRGRHLCRRLAGPVGGPDVVEDVSFRVAQHAADQQLVVRRLCHQRGLGDGL